MGVWRGGGQKRKSVPIKRLGNCFLDDEGIGSQNTNIVKEGSIASQEIEYGPVVLVYSKIQIK